ncbi:MAG: phytoene desaturase family protein [Chitinophagaceae bacterium]
MAKKVIVTGSGFAGLSAASFMAKAGWQVTVLEKHSGPGGRARQLKQDGFTFDMGPSWYWMPDVFERYFAQFGKKVSDLYQLQRLDPSYRVYWKDDFTDIPADILLLKKFFEATEPGAAAQLDKFLAEAAFKYRTGIEKLVFKPGQSYSEFIDKDFIKGIFKLDVFTSVKKHIHKFFKNAKLRQLLEFPVLFLGALPEHMPALYSLMNYADIVGGTWYPTGGMYSIVAGMYTTALDLGVQFEFEQNVQRLVIEDGKVRRVVTDKNEWLGDAVIVAADYHHAETNWLLPQYQSYDQGYWNKRIMAPSCLLYYVGLNKKLKNIQHHSLFFDTSFEKHAAEIYTDKKWPTDPMFYVSAVSVTDNTAAPEGCENLFLLIPVAAGLQADTEPLRDHYFNAIMSRMEKHFGEPLKEHVIFRQSFSVSDFVNEYNSFKGNAYGLANTLFQTATLKPSCRSKKVKNLFYTGQLTVPGPGVPPSLISGEVVAGEVIKYFHSVQ